MTKQVAKFNQVIFAHSLYFHGLKGVKVLRLHLMHLGEDIYVRLQMTLQCLDLSGESYACPYLLLSRCPRFFSSSN